MSYQHLSNGGGQQGHMYNSANGRNAAGANSYPYLGQINPNQTAEYVEQIAR